MDDDTGLELSLGLSCGGSSGKAKGNNNTTNNAGSSSENHRVEGGDRSAKVIDDFKNFLHPTSQRPSEPSSGSQRSDSGQQPPQNFFNDLSKAPTNDGEASTKPLWVEDETRKETGSKRKFGFSGMNDEKKKEKESSSSHVVDLHEKKTKASHVSTATDEGSTAENEDVADSEVGGGGGGSSSNLAKDVTRPNADTNIEDSLAGQRKSSNHGGSSAEEFTIRNMSSYTVPFTAHPQNVATSLPYSAKESGQHAAATSLMQPAASPGNLPVMFGYSPVQLPMLDKDGASGIVALSQSPFAGRGPSNSATAKGEGKQPLAEEGSSEDASERPTGENNNSNAAFSFDFSAIKPGMAADVKFGGSGARPNLPWVSTTGSGPHGRTISGVTYRYNANQIKIVCACHGSHMSPEEFVRHASEEYVSPESSIGMTAASAHT